MTYHRLTAVVAILVAVLTLACGGDDGQPPTPTSAPAGPTPPPIPTLPPQPTPTPPAGHPVGTRVGLDVINRTLGAVESGDPAQLGQMLSYTPYPCAAQDAAGAVVCPPGVTAGTMVDVVAAGDCDAKLLMRDGANLDGALRSFFGTTNIPGSWTPSVYAIVDVAEGRLASPLPIDYMIIFVNGQTLLLDDFGVTHIGFPCGDTGAEELFHPADTVILAPP